jgi:hypothetical protein
MDGEQVGWTIVGCVIAFVVGAIFLGMVYFLTNNSNHISDNDSVRDKKIQVARAHACEKADDVTVCLKLNKK